MVIYQPQVGKPCLYEKIVRVHVVYGRLSATKDYDVLCLTRATRRRWSIIKVIGPLTPVVPLDWVSHLAEQERLIALAFGVPGEYFKN